MPKITINDLKVEAARYSQWSVSWTDITARYHFWFDPKLVCRETDFVLYKNPPLTVERGAPTDFRTRQLDPTSKVWAPTIAEIWARIDRDDLIEKARDQLNADAIAERKRMEEHVALARKQKAGPELYEALRIARDALRINRNRAEAIRAATRAIKTAEGQS